MGAFRVQLVYQFVSESIVMALIAVVIGGILAEVGLPLVNSFAEKNIPPQIFLNPVVIPILLISAIVLGIFAGAYPAFYISHFRQQRFGKDFGQGTVTDEPRRAPVCVVILPYHGIVGGRRPAQISPHKRYGLRQRQSGCH